MTRCTLAFLILFSARFISAAEPQPDATRSDEILRANMQKEIAGQLAETVMQTEADWVEVADSTRAPGRRHWRCRKSTTGDRRPPTETDVVVQISVLPGEDRAREFMKGRRLLGMTPRFSELEAIFDEHAAAGPESMVPPGNWTLSCRDRSILIGIVAPSADTAVRFARLAAEEIWRRGAATR
jgi:hypothetical protein